MTEAIIGLVGVLIGSGITLFHSYWTRKQDEAKNARYLAIRCVCVLDKFVEDCMDVIKDDGLSFGERNKDGYLEPQVIAPGPPIYPNDVDWRSVDQEIMYKLISFPSEVEAGDRMIEFTKNIANPPNFEEWFLERNFYYCNFGMHAYNLSNELANKYGIKKKVYNNWNPELDFQNEFTRSSQIRKQHIEKNIRTYSTIRSMK